METKKTKIALRAVAVAIALLASALQEKEAEAKCAYQAPDGTVYVCAKGGDSCKKGHIQCPGSLVEIRPGTLLPLDR